jgi:hypothetical protein
MYRIGKLDEYTSEHAKDLNIDENRQKEMRNDFEKLRKLAIEMVS